jgi:hypothetical protein
MVQGRSMRTATAEDALVLRSGVNRRSTFLLH